METIDSVAVGDQFPAALGQGASLGYVHQSNGGYFAVTGADVYVQLAYGKLGQEKWTPPLHVAPGNGILIPGTAGIQFKNYIPGKVATVSAALAEQTEPSLTLTAAGVSTSSSGVTDLSYVEFNAPVAAASSAEASAVTVVSAIPLLFDGATRIRVEFYCPSWIQSNNTGGGILTLFDTTTLQPVGQIAKITWPGAPFSPTFNGPVLVAPEFIPPAGTRTYFVGITDAGVVSGLHATAQAGAGGTGALMPGHIKISTA